MVGLATKDARPNLHYDLVNPSTLINYGCPNQGWRYDRNRMLALINEERILWPSKPDGRSRQKVFLDDMSSEFTGFSSVLDFNVYTYHGTREIESIFNSRLFDFPKSSDFILKMLEQVTNKNAIILDSFAGSGTTAHAVLKQNAQDSGNRKFILIEIMDYAETITAERVRRVMNGYGEGTKAVAGLGGSFDYISVGEPLFLDDGNLNEVVGETAIRQYVAYSERVTLDTCDTMQAVNPHCLGLKDDALFVFYYQANAITALSMSFLATLAVNNLSSRPNSYVIYADKCTLTPDIMQKYGITFKRIPRDITRF